MREHVKKNEYQRENNKKKISLGQDKDEILKIFCGIVFSLS